MKVYGVLERAQAEILSSDPANLAGRFWYNSTGTSLKYSDGAIREFANLDGTQTFTGKTLTGNIMANVSPDGVNTITFPTSTDVLVGKATTDALTNKDYDGGTASNTSRLTVPSDTKSNLDGLTRKKATLNYATDSNTLYADDGTVLQEIGSGGGGKSVFETFDAEDNDLSGFTTSGGTLAIEDTVNVISGNNSYKYTSGGTGNYYRFPTIALEPRQLEALKTHSLAGLARILNGGQFEISVLDGFNATLGSVIIEKNDDADAVPFEILYNVIATSVSVKIQVKNLLESGSGDIIYLDDLVFNDDTLSTASLVTEVKAAYVSSAATSLSASFTTIKYLTNETDTHDAYNSSTGVYTVPMNGLYSIKASNACGAVATADGQYLVTYILVNSVNKGQYTNTSFNTRSFTQAAVSKTMYLYEGDEIEIAATSDIAASRTTGATESYQYFSIEMVKASDHVIRSDTQALEEQVDLTVTGTSSYSDVESKGIYYTTADGSHRLRFNIYGTSTTATSITLTIEGVTFKSTSANNQALASHHNSGSISSIYAYAQFNTGNILIGADATSPNWLVSGDVELESKPTWGTSLTSSVLYALPAAIDPSPVRYTSNNATQYFTSGAHIVVDFEDKEFDSDGLVTTGASWAWTAPKTGKVNVSAKIQFEYASWGNGYTAEMRVFKNGVAYGSLARKDMRVTSSSYIDLSGSDTVDVAEGDTLSIRGYQNTGTSKGITINVQNRVAIDYVTREDKTFVGTVAKTQTMMVHTYTGGSSYYTSEAATGSWKTHDLDSLENDIIGSISSNILTLPKGDYELEIPVAADDGSGWLTFQLYNVTDSVTYQSRFYACYSGTGETSLSSADIKMSVSIDSTKEFEFQTFSSVAAGNEYLGRIKVTKIR